MLIGVAAVDIGGGEFRIEPHRLVEIGDGAVEIAPLAIGEPAAVRGQRVARIEPDRLAQVGDGAVESWRS